MYSCLCEVFPMSPGLISCSPSLQVLVALLPTIFMSNWQAGPVCTSPAHILSCLLSCLHILTPVTPLFPALGRWFLLFPYSPWHRLNCIFGLQLGLMSLNGLLLLGMETTIPHMVFKAPYSLASLPCWPCLISAPYSPFITGPL